MSAITFRKGKGKNDRAAFVFGRALVPAAMVTRLLHEVEGLGETALMRKVVAKLGGKYDAFLDALDKAGVSYAQAIQEMRAAYPSRGQGKPRIGREAEAVAKALCRKYSDKEPDAMVAAFLETVRRPDFQALVVEHVKANLAKFGRNNQGKIRVRAQGKEADTKRRIAQANKARAGRRK